MPPHPSLPPPGWCETATAPPDKCRWCGRENTRDVPTGVVFCEHCDSEHLWPNHASGR